MDADFILDLVARFTAQGATPLEAISHFTRDQIQSAIFEGSGPIGADQRRLLDVVVQAGREQTNAEDMEQAIELWLAGWTSDSGTPPRDVFSWYWRAPAKGKRALGRKYLSTGQALSALRKQQKKQTPQA